MTQFMLSMVLFCVETYNEGTQLVVTGQPEIAAIGHDAS